MLPIITLAAIILSTIFLVISIYFYKKSPKKKSDDDRESLKAIYNNGNGLKWEAKYSENWLTSEPLNQWGGIEANYSDGNECVTEILMRNNRQFSGMSIFYFIVVNSANSNICRLISNLISIEKFSFN